jgi:hypothetical protein
MYFVSKSSGVGLYAISDNHTHIFGNPVINLPEPEINKSEKNVSSVPQVHSSKTESSISSMINNLIKDVVNSVKKQKKADKRKQYFDYNYEILQENFSLFMDAIKKVKNFDKFTENYLHNKEYLYEI